MNEAETWLQGHRDDRAHGLRHTHAYELMMEGLPVPIIQQQLGHTSLATADRYVSHLAPVDLISHMQKRDWSL